MNAGLITSYIVAGILLVAIISMNNSVSNSTSEITFSQMNREKLANITETFAGDVQKIGYNRTNKTDKMIDVANSHKLKFYSNIDNSSDNSAEIVIWEFTSNPLSNTANPNDYELVRSVEDTATGSIEQTVIQLGVTNFNLSYYDDYGKSLSDSLSTPVSTSKLSEIKQLYIRLKIESPQKIYKGPNGEGNYMPSVWEKRFSPPNLESNS